jgi:FdhD protein
MNSPAEAVEIVRVSGHQRERRKDLVVEEAIYSIRVNGTRVAALACTPSELDCLAVGFLLSERIITSYADVQDISIREGEGIIDVGTCAPLKFSTEERMATITSGCGSASAANPLELLRAWKVTSQLEVSARSVTSLVGEFQGASSLFRSTGGVHSAAICEPSGIIIFKDDIGRHNAVDKVLGTCAIKGILTRDKILLLSGRVSSDVLLKAALREIPVLVSQSAPTHLAVELASASGITLIGFARGERMNIYCHEWRIS